MMKTNIVMLIKDRPKLTWQSIRSLANNTPQDAYNLTIIDDGSEPDMAETLREIASNSTHVALLTNNSSKGITGQARNLGVYWAERYWGRGDWLYLTDNDVYFTPGWLERLVYALGSCGTSCSVVGGWNHPFLQPKEGTGDRAVPWVKFNNGYVLQQHDAVTGASQLMSWSTWDTYGPLDAHAVGVGQSEDWAFCQNIIKDGGRVGSIYPRVVLNCGITNSLGQPSPGADMMLSELHDAKLKHPDLYWE